MTPIAYALRAPDNTWVIRCPLCWMGGVADAEITSTNGDVIHCADCGKMIGVELDRFERFDITVTRELVSVLLACLNGQAYIASATGEVSLEMTLMSHRDTFLRSIRGIL